MDLFEFVGAAALLEMGCDVPTVRRHFDRTLRSDEAQGFPAFYEPGLDYLVVVHGIQQGADGPAAADESCFLTSWNSINSRLVAGFFVRACNLRLLVDHLERVAGEKVDAAGLRARFVHREAAKADGQE